ncbi:FKBP-type peptidyl-prolyl cis-trans isomerase [Glaciecola sp. 1036]|uniref:FKBP-type peptidyl-prolyl cis-trans isomerase n=1 Tax=Alteromonadaceae TaxID=72275 RepID=UPI003D035CE1
MKQAYIATILASALIVTACGGAKEEEKSTTEAPATSETAPAQETEATSQTNEYTTDAQKYSYALGASLGYYANNKLIEQEKVNLGVDRDALLAGFTEMLASKPRFSQQELQRLSQEADALLQSAQMEANKIAAEKNIVEGKTFLAENATKEGVKVTESGLQYEVLTEGEGKSPSAQDRVKVHYRGTLLDGTEFDSSYSRNAPATFRLNQVISGWTEGLQLMQEGAKFKFYIPAELAYRSRAQGKITPNSTLIFEVELLEVLEQ